MPWRGHLRKTCAICGEPRGDGEYLTKRGNHRDCAADRMHAEITQLRAHRGPYFDAWRGAVAASVGGVLVDARGDEG